MVSLVEIERLPKVATASHAASRTAGFPSLNLSVTMRVALVPQYIRARPAFQDANTAVYFLLHNHSDTADEILSASTDIAETAEIHKTEVNANGVMQMNMQTSVPLPVDAEIHFEPGGLHVMLTAVKKDLNVGDTFPLTLHFKVHADITLTVFVLDDGSMDHSHMDMDASPTP
jgi:copper(I)-binding protein